MAIPAFFIKPRNLTVAAALAALLVYGYWSNHSPRTTPPGQAPMVMLNAASLADFKATFNADSAHARIILLPSPT